MDALPHVTGAWSGLGEFGGQMAEMVFSKYVINGPVPDSAFALPAEVTPLVPKVAAKPAK